MPYVAPSTVVAGQTYSAASHNIIVNDLIDHEDRLDTVQNAQYPARNVLVNGAMQFAQRGTSVSGIAGTIDSYHTADRWLSQGASAGTWTEAISADAPTGSGFRNSLRFTCTTAVTSLSAGSYRFLTQRLEGQTLQHIKKGTASAQQLTLSFWVKGSTTGTYIAALYDSDNTRSVSGSYTISAANTWEQKTITFPADTTGALDNDNNGSLFVQFILAAGTDRTSGVLGTTWGAYTAANYAVGQTNLSAAVNNYWQITGVQLEPGSQASPFEFVRYDDELRRCQRYYEKTYPLATSPGTVTSQGALWKTVASDNANNVTTDVRFNTPKRSTGYAFSFFRSDTGASGLVYLRSGVGATLTTPYIDDTFKSQFGCWFYTGVGAAWVPAMIYGHWVANDEL